MRAMVYTARLQLEMQDVRERVAGVGEVIVDVRAAGICGSELEAVRTESPLRVPPLIMGHEFAGVRGDTGEPVVVNPLISCGRSDLCLRCPANICRERALLGIQRLGGFAERVAAPESALHPMPPGMTVTQGALVEPIANAFHVLRLVQEHDPQPQSIGVIGAGTLGLVTGIVARRLGVPRVDIADVNAERLATAEGEGLRAVGDALEGEFDIVVDAVGAAATRRAAVQRVRPGGTVAFLGLHEVDAGFDAPVLIRGEKRVLGTFAHVDRDFRAAIGLAAELEPRWLTTRPLDEGVDAFRALLEGPSAATKTLLVP